MTIFDQLFSAWGVTPTPEAPNRVVVPLDLLVRLAELAFGRKAYDEQSYLANCADVKSAVDGGAFYSGLEHFMKLGIVEGRPILDGEVDELAYIIAYADVKMAIDQGQFKSATEHWRKHGWAEGRLPTRERRRDAGAFAEAKRA